MYMYVFVPLVKFFYVKIDTILVIIRARVQWSCWSKKNFCAVFYFKDSHPGCLLTSAEAKDCISIHFHFLPVPPANTNILSIRFWLPESGASLERATPSGSCSRERDRRLWGQLFAVCVPRAVICTCAKRVSSFSGGVWHSAYIHLCSCTWLSKAMATLGKMDSPLSLGK